MREWQEGSKSDLFLEGKKSLSMPSLNDAEFHDNFIAPPSGDASIAILV